MHNGKCISLLLIFCVLITLAWGRADPSSRSVSPENCIVWGPGLLADFVLPVRYFYIQAVDLQGKNFTESVGMTAFTLTVMKEGGGRVPGGRDVIDRRDGSYIGRVRLNQMSRANIIISIKYENQHVADSPYKLEGPVFFDRCNCPQPDLHAWFSTMKCLDSYPQLQEDLSVFTSPINFSRVAEEVVERFTGAVSHYKIIDNKIYRRDYFDNNSITIGKYLDELLLSLSRKVRLPDVEFFMNKGDWPLEKRAGTDNPLPIVSWCGSDDTRDIVLPTYELIKSTIYMLERHNTDIFSVQGRTGPLWGHKTPQAFWRGRDSHNARLDLAALAQEHPDVLNASLTSVLFHPQNEKYGPLSSHVSFFDFFKYKYQINIDGTVAAYRLPFLLASDTLVLKQHSKYYEHFYNSMTPYVHYIPIKEDLSDLLEKINWAKEHDEEAEAIGRTSQNFVLAHLTPGDIYCYYAKFLYEFSTLLQNKPLWEEEFILVEPHDFKDDTSCDCEAENLSSHTEL